ncbi:MAG: hypothetical protein FWC75_02350 [Oscillospiraceae bacterium]|nr:hypothetical protein [Oscillospiraceae bacterium]
MFRKQMQYKQAISESIELIRENNKLLTAIINRDEQTKQKLDEICELIEAKGNVIGSTIDNAQLELKLQHEVAAVNFSAFDEYKNIHSGKDVVIAASGPTLNRYKQINNAVHIGVNSVCSNPDISLDYYFSQDFGVKIPRQVKFESDIANLNCKKFFGLLASVPNGLIEPPESLCARIGATRYFFEVSPSRHLYHDIRFRPLMDFYSVVFPALHFALFTNPKRIYLVGVDTSFGGYYTNENASETVAEAQHILYNRMIGFRRVREFAKTWYPETEIISINPVNLNGLFNDMYTDENGNLIEASNELSGINECDFTDDGIRAFVDNHIEQILLSKENSEKKVSDD